MDFLQWIRDLCKENGQRLSNLDLAWIAIFKVDDDGEGNKFCVSVERSEAGTKNDTFEVFSEAANWRTFFCL